MLGYIIVSLVLLAQIEPPKIWALLLLQYATRQGGGTGGGGDWREGIPMESNANRTRATIT